MTATQVFIRFCKEKGIYYKFRKILYEAIRKASKNESFNYGLNEMHGDKSFILDKFLKFKCGNLSSSIMTLYYSSYIFRSWMPRFYDAFKLSKEFNEYLRENLKGNYRKTFLPGYFNERYDNGKRRGYYSIDFSYKNK
jgi:hypothetical protein